MATFSGEVLRVRNMTGLAIATGILVSITGFDLPTNTITVGLAVANGTNKRADLITSSSIANQSVGYARRDHVLENINTAGIAVEAPIYLSPTVPGAWTSTRPSASGQDIHEVGVVVTTNATTGRILFQLQGGGARGFGPDSISSTLLTTKSLSNDGQASFTWIRFSGAITDQDRVSINGRIYEFDTAVGGTLGTTCQAGAHVRIGISGAGGEPANNAAGAVTALVTAINADATRSVNALDIGGDTVALSSLTAAAGLNYAVSDPIDTGNVITVRSANMSGSAAAAVLNTLMRTYTLIAADVTTLAVVLGTSEIVIGVFPATTTPALLLAQGQLANGSRQILDGALFTLRQINASYWALCYAEAAAGAILIAGDAIHFILITPA